MTLSFVKQQQRLHKLFFTANDIKLCDTTTEASNTLLYGDDIKLCDTTTEASHTLLYGDDIKLCDTTTEASNTLLYGDDSKFCETTKEASHTLLYGGDIKQSLEDAREYRRLTASLQQEFQFKRSTPTGPFFRTMGEGESKTDRLSPLCPKIQNEQKSFKSQVSALFTNIEQVR